jgi:DNA-binding transcriptional ArsR family regulator
MNNHRTLSTDQEIKAFLHRTRMDILSALRDGPTTASKIGERLGVHPANLTRHIRTLVSAGLVELVEKRDTGRNLEKYYAATAVSFDVAPEAGSVASPHRLALVHARSDISAALARIPDDDSPPVVVLIAGARISGKEIERFKKELDRLIASFSSADESTGTPYHLSLALYPGDIDESLCQEVRLDRRKE